MSPTFRAVLLGCWAVCANAQDDRRSKEYKRPPPHTVSGISSGGDMVMTHLFVESASVQGAAVVAGAPFGCNIVVKDAPWACATPIYRKEWKRDGLLQEADNYARMRAGKGLIDPVENLVGKRVFLFSGTEDWTVWKPVMKQVEQQLLNFSVVTYKVFNVATGHDWPVDDWTCKAGGEDCGSTGVVNIGYDMVGDFMPFITGRQLKRAHTNHTEHLYWVPQARYVPHHNAAKLGLDATAFLYLPPQCEKAPSKCHIHVQYHGCLGGQWFFGNEQAASYGFSEWALLNDIVVLFPQLVPWNKDTWGCWDWSGETGVDFDTYRGGQIGTVVNMLRHIDEVAAERTTVPATYAPEPPSKESP